MVNINEKRYNTKKKSSYENLPVPPIPANSDELGKGLGGSVTPCLVQLSFILLLILQAKESNVESQE